MWDPRWTLYDSLRIFAEKHPGEELVLTEAQIYRITGMGVAMRSALRKAGFVNPRRGVWVRPAE
jgi:hypothetical protein